MTTSLLYASIAGPTALLLAGIGHKPRLLQLATLLNLGTALALALAVASWGTLETPLLGVAGLGLSLRADPLAVTLLVMVSLLGLVLFAYGQSYLEGSPRRGVFLARIAQVLFAVECLLLAGNLVVFVAAWTGASLALHRLLLFFPERRRAQLAARKKFLVARAREVCLLLAAALLYRSAGSGELDVICAAGSASALPALLLALAALIKSAQFPTQGWLLELMETPTPVSALLHAGVLNAGPFLILRFAPALSESAVAGCLLVGVGGLTALVASAAMRTQPTVKVALAYSSSAHMGFSLLLCGLGAYPAALLHLVAHSFYKAHAFLSAGSAIDRARAPRFAPTERLQSLPRLALALALAICLFAGATQLTGVELSEHPGVAAFAVVLSVALAQLFAPALDARATLWLRSRLLIRGAGVLLAFFCLEELARWSLRLPAAPALAGPKALVSGLVLGGFALAGAAQLLDPRGTSRPAAALQAHLRNGLYANALFDRLVGAYRR